VRATVLLVGLLVLLAGCNGLTGAGEPTPTVTAAEVPAEAAAYPPGIDDGGATAPDVLAAAHSDRVENRSYVLVSNRTVRYTNGTVRSALSVRVALADDRSYLVRVRTDGSEAPVLVGRPPANATYWSDGETYARKLTRGDRTTYTLFSPPDQYTATWRFWTQTVAFGGGSGYAGGTIRDTFGAVPTTLDGTVTRNGTELYRLTGEGTTVAGRMAPELDTVNAVTLEAAVGRNGVVRRIAYRVDGDIDGTTVTVDRTIEYRRVGSTTVEAPPWLDRARNESG